MICAMVLAAGRARRMGTQKLLLPIAGKPAVARIVDALLLTSLTATYVVTGTDGERIQQALSGRSVTFINNPDGDSDMLSSIRCGLRALPSRCTAVLIVLGDQPNLTSELVARLIDGIKIAGCGIIVPMHEGHRGHPVLIDARFRDELLACHDTTGLRGFLNAHPEEVFAVEIFDGATLLDMDTPEDYQRHLSSRPG